MRPTSEADLIEPTFGQDDFRKPKIRKGNDVILQAILMILFGKPGCYPSIPEIGMNIQQYRMSRFDESLIEELKAKLDFQCGLIRERIISTEVSMKFTYSNSGQGVLLIAIPVVKDDAATMLIGISENDENMTYNYQLVNEMLML